MSDVTTLYEVLDRCLAAGETVAVATIVQRKGSSPREIGAKMLIRANGDTDGTIGGGCGEADVWRAALDVMADLEPRTVVVDLTEEIAMNTDGVCGGIMEIFVEPWIPDTKKPDADGSERRALTRGLLGAVAAKRPAVLATVVGLSGAAPCARGARLLVVDGEDKAGDLGWEWLQAQILADVAEVMVAGRSHTRTYAVDPLPPPPSRSSSSQRCRSRR
jgi:xanthine dehydrogenase accessory factor